MTRKSQTVAELATAYRMNAKYGDGLLPLRYAVAQRYLEIDPKVSGLTLAEARDIVGDY